MSAGRSFTRSPARDTCPWCSRARRAAAACPAGSSTATCATAPRSTGAAEGVDAICHTAALVSIWRARREEFDEVNLGGFNNVIDVCQTLGLTRLVYTSSFLALPPVGPRRRRSRRTTISGPKSPGSRSRAARPRGACRSSRSARASIYGPGTATEGNLVGRLVRDHLDGRLPGIIGADRLWSFAYVDDVAAAHVAALTRGEPGREYAVGGENAAPDAPVRDPPAVSRDLPAPPHPLCASRRRWRAWRKAWPASSAGPRS